MANLEKATKLLKENLLEKVSSSYPLKISDFRSQKKENSIIIEIRHLGIWEDIEIEDYDLNQLTNMSIKQINKIVKTIKENTKTNITWSEEEKNWVIFTIKE